MAYDFKGTEPKIYELWLKSGFFNPNNLPGKRTKTYTIMLPPPNVTGTLHMGHALNATIQDILIRQKRMQGFKTLWLPGTDHAGIATQNVVEKELRKEGLTRFDLGKEKFIEKVWEWKEKYGNIILEQLKKMGASCDWSRTRFTMDEGYVKAVETAFTNYYEKGWIYRGKRVVNWCTRCRTSISDLEIDYQEEKGNLWHIKYPFANKNIKVGGLNYIVVATTRPETMLGDTAVAVNPKDERYKSVIGEKLILPLTNREIEIVTDGLVDKEFGTGAVKVTPAHDLIDQEIGKNHNLEILKIIDEEGKIVEPAPTPYQGMRANDARKKVIEDLQQQRFLEKTEEHIHQVPHCDRCKTTIELLPSTQWFLKMDELAKIALKALKTKKIRFQPEKWEKGYIDWLSNIRDWCISRQLWWGHKIPLEN
jgi:valyl-tRNA synthetase